MQLYYIRHAQSTNNALYDQTGSSKGRSPDPDLTPAGYEQAKHLAAFVNQPFRPAGEDPRNDCGFGLTHIYTSLMVRAVKTAFPIARATGVPVVGWEIIHEEGGIYTSDETTDEKIGQPGMPRNYFERHFPGLILPEWLGEDGWYQAQQYEAYELRLSRAKLFLEEIKKSHAGTQDRVAVVSHGGFFNLCMTVLLGLESRDGYWFLMNNAAISRFDFHEDHVAAVYMNRTDHLPAHLIT